MPNNPLDEYLEKYAELANMKQVLDLLSKVVLMDEDDFNIFIGFLSLIRKASRDRI